MRPIQAILALETISDSLKCPVRRNGLDLTLRDRRTVIEVYQQWLCLFLDLGILPSCRFETMARRLLTDLLERDVLEVNKSFAELLYSVRVQRPKGFKGLCSRVSPHLYSLVKDLWKRCLSGDVFAAKPLTQLFSYTSRLSLQDIDLTEECLRDYLRVESSIDDRYPESLCHDLNITIRSWLKDFDSSNLHFRHSNGAVAEKGVRSLEAKYECLTSDQMLTFCFGDPWWSVRSSSKLRRVSRTRFVPKSYKTFRTISMEPATLMYIQQGVWNEIRTLVSRTPYLRNHIGFDDQERNQKLARIGSLNRNYATIDLSSASDSVSYELVKKLFKGSKVYKYLIGTRSSMTLLPSGITLKLKKFAPMGSALCFPVETIIFAAVCDLVTRRHGVAADYSVYGDDIIVPTQCVGDVVNVLFALGFVTNSDKSFSRTDCWFRESCGAEYCDGYDVTPMRVSRKYTHHKRDVRLSELMSLANMAYDRGYFTLRSYFIRKLFGQVVRYRFHQKGKKFQYIDGPILPMFGLLALKSDESTNFHLKHRFNPDLQTEEVYCTKVYTETARGSEDLRLRHWFEETQNRDVRPSRHDLDASKKLAKIRSRYRDYDCKSLIGKSTVVVTMDWVIRPSE